MTIDLASAAQDIASLIECGKNFTVNNYILPCRKDARATDKKTWSCPCSLQLCAVKSLIFKLSVNWGELIIPF